MKKFLKRVWEAPQKAVAHLVKRFAKAEELTDPDETLHIYLWGHGGGMSLSNHIFLPRRSFKDLGVDEIRNSKWHHDYLMHEYGHTIQSQKLGPIYLLVIGLPSLIWAGCFETWRIKHKKSYYVFYTEKWADKLGGVSREDE